MVSCALGDMEKDIAILLENVQKLIARLSPVLRSEPSCCDKKEQEPPHGVPLVNRLKIIRNGLEAINANIEDANRRLEI